MSIMKSMSVSDAGNYTCGFVTADHFTAERHFRIIVNCECMGALHVCTVHFLYRLHYNDSNNG